MGLGYIDLEKRSHIYKFTRGVGFKKVFFHLYLGKIPILTNVCSTGLKPTTSTGEPIPHDFLILHPVKGTLRISRHPVIFSADDWGVENHLRNAWYLGSITILSFGEPGSLGIGLKA